MAKQTAEEKYRMTSKQLDNARKKVGGTNFQSFLDKRRIEVIKDSIGASHKPMKKMKKK